MSGRAAARAAATAAIAILATSGSSESAFEWRHEPASSALPLAAGDETGALGIFISPALARAPRAAAVATSQPYALEGARAGALAAVAGSHIGAGLGAAWLRLDGYAEQQALAAVSVPIGPARAGMGARLLSASVAGYTGTWALAHEAGLEIRGSRWGSLAVAAGPFVSAGGRALRAGVTPEIVMAGSAAVAPGVRLLGETREPAGHPNELALGVSWAPAASLRVGMAVVLDPPAMRAAVAFAPGAVAVAASYAERPPLPPTVAASLEVRP